MTPVNCNECGNELEVGPATNFVTCGRRSARLAVRRTGTSVFTERVAHAGDLRITDTPLAPAPRIEAPEPPEPPANDPVTRARLAELEREARIARIDREWEVERQQYMMSDRYGVRHIPSPGAAIGVGVVVVGFGLLWTIFTLNMTRGFPSPGGGFDFFPCFGVLFMLFGAGMSVFTYNKAQAYLKALEQYQARRRAAEQDGKESYP